MRTAQDIVSQEVHYCVSSLVSTLAGGYGLDHFQNGGNRASPGASHSYAELADLCEQAMELAAPIDDWEEPLIQAGWQHAPNSATWISPNDFHKRISGDPRTICDEIGLEPYQREVYEHWVVSDWLAEKLEAAGEKVDRDFAGMTVWARTTTGQAIYADGFFEQLAASLSA